MTAPVLRLSLETNVAEARRRFSRAPRQVQAAARRAINRTGTQARRQALRFLAREVGLSQKKIGERVTIRRANYSSLVVTITARGKAYNIASFGARQLKGGVRSRAWGKSKFYPHGFIIHGATAFIRTGAARVPSRGRYAGLGIRREALKPLFGPKIPREFERSVVNTAMVETVRDRFPVNFRQQLRYALRGTGYTLE